MHIYGAGGNDFDRGAANVFEAPSLPPPPVVEQTPTTPSTPEAGPELTKVWPTFRRFEEVHRRPSMSCSMKFTTLTLNGGLHT